MNSLSLWNWLKSLQRHFKVGRRRPRGHERTVRGRMVPRLEALEDRTVPSTLTVTNNLDTGIAGDGSLRGEIAAASSGDMIQFASSLAGQTITLTQGELAINQSLDIEGLGANQLTISGNNQSRVLDITASTASVTIAGLTISGGLDSYGSGITNVGTLTVNDCTLSGNVANSSAGGAIDNSGMLTINNSTISGNRVVAAPGFSTGSGLVAGQGNDGCGGGIYTSGGTLSINSSTIADNAATGGDGAGVLSPGVISAAGNGCGGGLYIAGGTVTINNSTLAGNQAVGGFSFSSNSSDGFGGGIENAGGTVSINNSTLSGNLAIGGVNPGHSVGFGGGINNDAGTVTVNDSTLADNQAVGGCTTTSRLTSPGITHVYAGNGHGGGLYIAGGTVSIDNTTLADNQAIGGSSFGGGTGYGGGIDNAAGTSALQVHDTIVANNTADSDPDLDGGLTSQGHNLIENTTGGNGFAASDLVNVNPQLGPLQNYGGPTQTMALLPGSPAVNTGDNTNAPAYDQRGPGYPRIVGGFIDIGAFEVQNSSGPTQASRLTITAFPSVVTAGSAGSFTVTALNADGTTDTSYTGTVRFSSGDVQAGLPAVYTFTAADGGVHPFSATLKTAGTQSITVTDFIFGTTGTETGISVTPGAASQLAFAQQPSNTTAGQVISPAVTVKEEDMYGNLVAGDSSMVTVTLSSGTFAGGSNTALAQASGGVATFSALTIDKASGYNLRAADGSLTPALTAAFTVTPAAASMLVVSGFLSPTSAGATHSFLVTAEDPYGNVATNYLGTVHFTSSDARAVLPANYTFTAAAAGRHSFFATLKTAGTQSITATDTASASLTATDGGITVQPASASKFVLTGLSSVSAGVAFSLTLTVEDAYGNIVSGYTGTVHFSSTDGTALLPANYTFTAGDAGVHTFTGLVLHKKRNQKITVTDTLNSSLTGSVIEEVW
jgi:hypothetical protein